MSAFHLTEEELDRGYNALVNHGVSGFLPEPPEWISLKANWPEIRLEFSKLDLHIYKPYVPRTTFVRKNRKFVRAIEFVHPQDIVIYTSLTMLMRDSIEDARLDPNMKKSFSYRVAGAGPDYLYKTFGQYQKYRDQTEKRIGLKKTEFVTTADIAQFFPHVYQHRLANALAAAASDSRQTEAARIIEKLVGRFSSGKSYGIPTGPFASRCLAEALLIDVDAALHQAGFDYVRWMDDFTFFTKTRGRAEEAIGFLSAWLHEHHGLILNQQKTHIYAKDEFVSEVWKTYDDEHQHFRQLVKKFKTTGYDDDEFDEEDIEPAELSEIMELALTISEEPKFGLIKHLLESVIFRDDVDGETRKTAIETAIDNFEALEPIFDSIAKSMIRSEEFSANEIKAFCKKVLTSIKSRTIFVAGHFESWLHWLIGEAGCSSLKAELISRLAEQNDAVVRREILIALSKIADRADTLFIKTQLPSIGSVERVPAIMATKVWGKDERKFWRAASNITDRHEKLAFSA